MISKDLRAEAWGLAYADRAGWRERFEMLADLLDDIDDHECGPLSKAATELRRRAGRKGAN